VAESDGHLREILTNIERHVANVADVELLDVETAWLDPDPFPLGGE
jgi:hypothetical protein